MKISPAQSDFLNWSRWVAAWLVVAEHVRSLIFVDYGELHSPGVWAKGFYFLTGFGHEAVMVFFVISGYLVGGKVWSLCRGGRFAWRRYLADRLSRLYAVLFVALLLGAAMDWTGYLFFNKYGLYNQGYEGSIAVLGVAPIARIGWQDFLANTLFLQTIVGQPYGSNGPLWSLAYEWWYYILFPLVLAAVWPIVDYGWRFFKGDRRTKIGDRGEEEILTTEDTERTEDGAGPCLDKPSGAAFSNPSTSELARDSENTSLTHPASGPASARIAPGEMGSVGGNQLADSGEFLEGQSQAGLQMGSQKLHSPRVATESDTSGKNSSSVPIREIRGQNSGPLDAGRSTLDLVPEAPNVFVLGVAPMARWWEGARERNAVIREINARLAAGSGENGYRFIELESALADENGFLRGELTSDGVHLSAKGYVAVLEKMKQGSLRGR